MDKYVMMRYDADTGDCMVIDPHDTVAQVCGTGREVHIPGGPKKVVFTNPISMTVHYDVNPIGKARQEGYDNGFEFGRNEVWRIVGDLLFDPDYGIDFMIFGGWKCQSDIFKDTYGHVFEVIQKWRERPKRFDIVKVRIVEVEEEAIITVEEEAIITRVDGDNVDLMCRGGKTARRNIKYVTKTGKTLEYELLKWVKGE